jgi:hypothetical protein
MRWDQRVVELACRKNRSRANGRALVIAFVLSGLSFSAPSAWRSRRGTGPSRNRARDGPADRVLGRNRRHLFVVSSPLENIHLHSNDRTDGRRVKRHLATDLAIVCPGPRWKRRGCPGGLSHLDGEVAQTVHCAPGANLKRTIRNGEHNQFGGVREARSSARDRQSGRSISATHSSRRTGARRRLDVDAADDDSET